MLYKTIQSLFICRLKGKPLQKMVGYYNIVVLCSFKLNHSSLITSTVHVTNFDELTNTSATLQRDDSPFRIYMLLRVVAMRPRITPPKLHIQN